MDVICWNSRVATAEGMMLDTFGIDQFLKKECEIDASNMVSSSKLYRAYLEFTTQNKFQPISMMHFSLYLQESGYERKYRRNRAFFHGVSLRDRGACDYPSHDIYDGKTMTCPSCNHQKISARDAARGINKGQQLRLKTKAFCRALLELASAARDFVIG